MSDELTTAPAEPCAQCGQDFEHLWHGSTGTENDHDFQPPREGREPVPAGLRDAIDQAQHQEQEEA